MRERYTRDAYLVLLLAGQWRRCIDFLGPQSTDEPNRIPQQDAVHELAVGVAYTFSGRGAEPLGPLISAVAQLEIHPIQSGLRCAYSATALAYAQTGNAAARPGSTSPNSSASPVSPTSPRNA